MKNTFKKENHSGFQKGYIPWNKGIKMPDSMIKKMQGNRNSIGSRSRLGISQSEETKRKISIAHKGKKMPLITGENHPMWIKDRTKLKRISSQGERRTSAYFEWRKRVWMRDNWKCRIANKDCKGRLEAHHILSYKDYPELRYEVNNGITLCHFHHPRKREEESKLSPYFQSLVAEKQ